jgi:hypothetical protein
MSDLKRDTLNEMNETSQSDVLKALDKATRFVKKEDKRSRDVSTQRTGKFKGRDLSLVPSSIVKGKGATNSEQPMEGRSSVK